MAIARSRSGFGVGFSKPTKTPKRNAPQSE